MPLKVLPSSHQVSAKGFVDWLVEKNLLKPGFRSFLAGKSISEIKDYLLEKNLAAPKQLAEWMAAYYRLPFVSLLDRSVDPKVVRLLPREVVERYKVLPIELNNLVLTLAITDPAMLQTSAPTALTQLRQEKGLTIQLVIASEDEAKAVLDRAYASSSPSPAGPPAATSATPPAGQPPAPPVVRPPLPDHPEVLKKVEVRGKPIDLRTIQISPETLTRLPYAVAKKYRLIVFEANPRHTQFEPPMVKIAMVNPEDPHVKEIVGYIEQRNKVLTDHYYTDEASFQAALALYPEAAADSKAQPTTASTVTEKPAETALGEGNSAAAQAKPTPAPQPIQPAPTSAVTLQPNPGARQALHQPTVSASQTASVLTLSASDIINRPNQESSKDLAKLAEQQENMLEDQNLDKLIHKPILSLPDLAEVYRAGVIPEIVAATLFLAIRMRASDVHIDSEKESIRVRYRIDGILHDMLNAPAFLHAPLISRIKILSKMKIDESRVPQDGRFDVILDNRQIDLRVATLPTVHGEKVVMRLLDKSEQMQTLEQLGLTGSNFDVLIKNIAKPFGIILSTGPTGSGKSTTLYSILARISRPGVNIITLEDPVEYELPGLNQAQVMPQIGFTFAEGLRSVLRQDPNVIMVGEIRDLETAAMATQAALTGHLVLSTLHTNDSSGALPRLIDMGVEPFLITSSLNAVVGQRLVRRICENCREKVEIPAAILARVQKELAAMPSGQLKDVNLEQLVFYHGKGCAECAEGYKGRIGIFEVMDMSAAIEELSVRKAPSSEIQKAAIAAGMVTMIQDGLMKALKGITTVDEVMRVTMASIKEVPGLAE